MYKYPYAILIMLGIFIAGFSIPSQADGVHRASRPVPGQYIVVLRGPTASFDTVNDEGNEIDVDVEADRLAFKHKGQVDRTWRHALKGMVMLMSPVEAEALAKDPNVALVEEDGVIELDTTQSPATWGLDRIDQHDLPLNNSYVYNTSGSGVTAYVIDTGIRITHSEFGGRASGGFTAINDGNGTNDCNGHGTHVAGTIGGATWGVAKAVALKAVRVLDCSGSGYTSGVISGVDWVTANRTLPAVANMSLGGGLSSALDTAVVNSINSGITYAIAAGNSNVSACTTSPARVASALTVGATSTNDARASFSNFGTCLDLFAPGVGITSAWNTSNTATNTISGTSMATPHVAGAAALYLSTQPGKMPTDVATALTGNATANKVTNPGTGSPNRLLYTGFIASGPPDTTLPTVSLTSPTEGQILTGTVTLSANASDNVAVAKVQFFGGTTLLGTATATPYQLSWNSSALANNSYAFTAKATDTSGNVATSASVNATTSNTSPPACSTSKQLLGNPGFETGSASPWTATTGVIDGSNPPAPHTGSWKAWLDGYGVSHTDQLYQQVTIPADACTANFSFWLWISTGETTTTSAFDTMTVTVLNTSGTVLRTLATYSNLNKSNGYVQKSFNLADFRGQTVRLQFRGIEDSSLQTSFFLDDAAVNITQ
ncbi:MAG: S8 family serine peptidase [Methylobacter sp.]|nr:S8 family serine peptidase [Methylobacter sp.]